MNFIDLVDHLTPDWHAQAVCHPDNGHDPAIWFPTRPHGGNLTHDDVIRPAVALCNTCPVRLQCLADAKKREEQWGVWGGVSFEHMTKLKRPVAECGTDSGYGRHRRLGEDACTACKNAHNEAKKNVARRSA